MFDENTRMRNFYEETLDSIKYNDLSIQDIAFITNDEYWITWDTFKQCVENYMYDSSYGGVYISLALKIVFNNGSWMERHEYDGSESWHFKMIPIRPSDECTGNYMANMILE